MNLTAELRGVDAAIRALDELDGRPARKGRQRALAAGARVARGAARKTAAFVDRTGRLRKSIRVKSVRERGSETPGVLLIAGGPGAAQASLVELGHGGPHPAPARPFIEPAAISTQGRAFDAIAAAAERELDKLAGRR